MHSPKVPHPDFSVQVVRHNLKIFAVENFDETLRDWEKKLDQFRVPHIRRDLIRPRIPVPAKCRVRSKYYRLLRRIPPNQPR